MVDLQHQDSATGNTPAELAAAADEYRNALANTVREFRSSIAPAPMARAAGDAVRDTFETGAARVEGKTGALLTGAVAMAALLSGSIWRKRTSTSAPSATPDVTAGVQPAATLPRATVQSSNGRSRSLLSNLVDIAPKLSAGIAIGLVVDRYLPRIEGEEDVWRDAKAAIGQKYDAIVTRELRARAEQPGSVLPYLGVLATILHALNKRSERSTAPD